MNEINRQRAIRIIIIFLSIILVGIGFFLQQKETENTEYEIKAVVIHRSERLEDSPIVAVYRRLNGKHLLILYEIDRLDKNRFKAMKEVEIENEPTRLLADRNKNGVWVLIKKKWTFYNAELIKEKRDTFYRDDDSNKSLPYRLESGGKVKIQLKNETFYFKIADYENITGIYSISDGNLLFVLLKNDIKVLVLK
jgi:hypothetical protein